MNDAGRPLVPSHERTGTGLDYLRRILAGEYAWVPIGEHLGFHLREVEHRTKNMMAVVQSTLRVGASTETDAKALAKAVNGRINALVRAQRLLSQSQWLHADLGTLIANELRMFQDAADPANARIYLSGPTIELSAAVAQALTLVVHELATNAAKYGSLSIPEGHVVVNWSLA